MRPVAVGECGLDYHYDHSPRDAQRDAFAAQIALAHELGLPLVIHTREAWDDTFDILDAEGVPARTVFHCFTGGPDDARRCLDRGAYLSFSGIVTFNGAPEVREAAALTPLDRTARRDRQPVPGAGAPPGQAQPAGLGARSSGPAWPTCTASTSPRPRRDATQRVNRRSAAPDAAFAFGARVFLAFSSFTWTGTGDRPPEQGATPEVRRS